MNYFLRAFYNTLQCVSKCFLLRYVFRLSKVPSGKFKNCLEYYEEENPQKYMEHPLLLSVGVRLKVFEIIQIFPNVHIHMNLLKYNKTYVSQFSTKTAIQLYKKYTYKLYDTKQPQYNLIFKPILVIIMQ